ncbi:glutathione peroxidase [Fusobacterium ulcerans]|uniref:glutathione peroxidase n=1 Tax=Fusobacterium ulcerans TaxID=861 RepID=UPI003FF0993D
MTIYDFKVKNVDGTEETLEKYRGKVLLIVNTATRCGLTSQYEGLEKLYEKYRDKGFEILDFPSNQFLKQAPESSEEIAEFCQLRYGTKFKTFAKIDVNGKDADPLYIYLKDKANEEIKNRETDSFKDKLEKLGQTLLGKEIKWNFTKFLIGKDGEIIGRFSPTVTPDEIDAEVARAILK